MSFTPIIAYQGPLHFPDDPISSAVAASSLPDALVRLIGHAKTAPGVLTVTINVLPPSFASGATPPGLVTAHVYPADTLDLTVEQVASTPTVASAAVAVADPGCVNFDLTGLAPGTDYKLVIVAE